MASFNLSSVVLVGRFNPAIFHPSWFERYKILPIQEIQSAIGERPKRLMSKIDDKNLIIEEVPPLITTHNKAVLFFPSMEFDITVSRYQCLTKKRENFLLIKEVTQKIINLLSHTPIKAIGINFESHLKINNKVQCELKGLFAKKDEKFKEVFGENYQIEGKLIAPFKNGKLSLKVSPSNQSNEMIFLAFNYHFDMEPTLPSVDIIIDILNGYENKLENSVKIINKLIEIKS